MRTNRLIRGNAIAADPADITPEEYEARKEARFQAMCDLADDNRDISTGEKLPLSLIAEMAQEDDDPEPVAPLPRVEVAVPRPVKPAPGQRELFNTHPDIIPSEPEALLGLMQPTCF